MANNGFSDSQIAQIEAIVRRLASLPSPGDARALEQKIAEVAQAVKSIETRASAQSSGFAGSGELLMNSISERLDDFKAHYTRILDDAKETQAKLFAMERQLKDFEGLIRDYPDERQKIHKVHGAVDGLTKDISYLKTPWYKRSRFWAISTPTMAFILALVFGDNFLRSDPVLPYYAHKFLRTGSGIAEYLKYEKDSDLGAQLNEHTLKFVDSDPEFEKRIVSKAHEKPVYAFHGAQYFQQQFIEIPHAACQAMEHPSIDYLVDYSLSLAQQESTDPEEYTRFVAEVSGFDCETKQKIPVVTQSSLEVPFYGRPQKDSIVLEMLVDYTLWDEHEQGPVRQDIKIDKFDVSINGELGVSADQFSELAQGRGVYRADISALMAASPSRTRSYHVLSVRLKDTQLLVGATDAEFQPIVRVQAIIYTNRVEG